MAFACQNHTLKSLENSYVISDEGAYKTALCLHLNGKSKMK